MRGLVCETVCRDESAACCWVFEFTVERRRRSMQAWRVAVIHCQGRAAGGKAALSSKCRRPRHTETPGDARGLDRRGVRGPGRGSRDRLADSGRLVASEFPAPPSSFPPPPPPAPDSLVPLSHHHLFSLLHRRRLRVLPSPEATPSRTWKAHRVSMTQEPTRQLARWATPLPPPLPPFRTVSLRSTRQAPVRPPRLDSRSSPTDRAYSVLPAA